MLDCMNSVRLVARDFAVALAYGGGMCALVCVTFTLGLTTTLPDILVIMACIGARHAMYICLAYSDPFGMIFADTNTTVTVRYFHPFSMFSLSLISMFLGECLCFFLPMCVCMCSCPVTMNPKDLPIAPTPSVFSDQDYGD